MVAHARKTIINAAVTQIDANTADLTVSDVALDHTKVADGDYPIVRVERGTTNYNNFITVTQEGVLTIKVKVMAKAVTTDDQMDDFEQAIIDAINTDSTLGGTCISCFVLNSDPPDLDVANNYKYTIIRFAATYWKDA